MAKQNIILLQIYLIQDELQIDSNDNISLMYQENQEWKIENQLNNELSNRIIVENAPNDVISIGKQRVCQKYVKNITNIICQEFKDKLVSIIPNEFDMFNIIVGDDFICLQNYMKFICTGNEFIISSIPKDIKDSDTNLIKEVWHNQNNNICVFQKQDQIYRQDKLRIRCFGNISTGINDVPDKVEEIISKKNIEFQVALGFDTACLAHGIVQLEFSCWGRCTGSLCSIPPSIKELDFIRQEIELKIGHDHGCIIKYENGFVMKILNYDIHRNDKVSGTLQCWGSKNQGKSIIPEQYTKNIITMNVGHHITCAAKKNGIVGCWGLRHQYFTSFNSKLWEISAGGRHNCATTSGRQQCWGNNEFGQLDLGVGNRWDDVTAVSAGWDYSCFFGANQKVECVGFNYQGQTDVLDINSDSIHDIEMIKYDKFVIKKLDSGVNHSCVLQVFSENSNNFAYLRPASENTKGRVRCWGGPNDFGQLDLDQPALDKINTISNIAVGHDFTCLIHKKIIEYTFQCYGNNDMGQAESFTNENSVNEMSAGAAHLCQLQIQVFCVGNDKFGQLKVPKDLMRSKNLSAGDTHTCVIEVSSDIVVCWGYFQLKSMDLKAYQMATGQESICIVDLNKKGICYGDNEQGQCDVPKQQMKELS